MQTTREIDPKTGKVTITISGEVENLFETVKKAAQEMLQDPEFHHGADALWDLRKAEVKHLSTDKVLSLIAFLKAHQQERGTGYKVAIVVEHDLLFGDARMFEAFADGASFNCRVFRDIEQAERWIGNQQ